MARLESVVQHLTTWSWRQARRAAGRPDPGPDGLREASLGLLHEIVEAKLAGDPALRQLRIEAGSDLDSPAVRPITGRRVRLALENEAEADPVFAACLRDLDAQLRAATAPPGGRAASTVSVSTSADRSVTMGGPAARPA